MFYKLVRAPGARSFRCRETEQSFAAKTLDVVASTSVVVVLVLLINLFTLCESQTSTANGNLKARHAVFKGYSGYRRKPDSQRQVYIFDQTIAVVEIGPGRQLVNCELLEIYRPGEEQTALETLRSVGKPHKIDFGKMIKLMQQCYELDVRLDELIKPEKGPRVIEVKAAPDPAKSERTSSIFSGILPGTLWCGTGDLAETYHHLGPERNLDRCCRAHDLCPVKVQGSSTKYNVTNQSIYTKSHCTCDDTLSKCLKASKNPTADLMGNIYFNILRVQCVNDVNGRKEFKNNLKY